MERLVISLSVIDVLLQMVQIRIIAKSMEQNMSVYVDDAFLKYRNMKMCHLVADTQEELLSMVDKIGVRRKWIQNPRTHKEHFDICSSKRILAVKAGAIEVTGAQLVIAIYKIGRGHNGKLTIIPR
jgi:hypothetical protein